MGNNQLGTRMSLPVRGAWIEIDAARQPPLYPRLSLPVRGAWIEMTTLLTSIKQSTVAPRAGSVD